MRDEDYLAGLAAERENHARAGRADRVEQIDAEVARLTGKPPLAVERAVRKGRVEKRG